MALRNLLSTADKQQCEKLGFKCTKKHGHTQAHWKWDRTNTVKGGKTKWDWKKDSTKTEIVSDTIITPQPLYELLIKKTNEAHKSMKEQLTKSLFEPSPFFSGGNTASPGAVYYSNVQDIGAWPI